MMMLVAIFLVATLALAAACGGGDDDDDTGGDDEATPTEDAGDDDEGDDEGDEETPGGDDDDNDGDGGGDDDDANAILSDLGELSGSYEDFSGYVKYEITSSGVPTTTMAIYQDGANSRLDTGSDPGSDSGDAIFITTPDASYLCSNDQCLKYPVEEGENINPAAGLLALIDPDTIDETWGGFGDDANVDHYSEEIAGLDAECFSYDYDIEATNYSGSTCFSESGILLRLTYESGGIGGGYEAVEASDDVPDGIFDPPYDVTDLSELFPDG